MPLLDVKLASNIVRYRAYNLTTDSIRIYYCNAIMFENSGTGNVMINDIYTLMPGESLSLSGNQGEIDFTPYKINFIPGFNNILQIWIKEDTGIAAFVEKNLPPQNATRPDRRKQNRDYEKKIKPNSDF